MLALKKKQLDEILNKSDQRLMSAAFLSLTIKHLFYVNKVIKTIKNPGVMTRSRGNYRLASMGTSQLKTY